MDDTIGPRLEKDKNAEKMSMKEKSNARAIALIALGVSNGPGSPV
jgi:hypothetical protein